MSDQTNAGTKRPVRNTATISLSIKPELKAKLVELAEKDRRSVSSYTSILLERVLEEMENGRR